MYGAATTKARQPFVGGGGLTVDPDVVRRQRLGKCCLNVIAAVATCTGAFGLWHMTGDLHSHFWLGRMPELTLAVLTLSSFVIVVIIYRKNSGRQQHLFYKGGSVSFYRRQFVVVLLLVLAVLACGAQTLRSGASVSSSLATQCGAANTTSGSLEAAHKRLVDFAGRCRHAAGPDGWALPVDQCPGFEDAFPSPAPYAMYLRRLELRDSCAGFCERTNRPLFAALPAEARRARIDLPSCSQTLADHLWHVALLVGAPSIAVGALILGVAVFCYFFDEFL